MNWFAWTPLQMLMLHHLSIDRSLHLIQIFWSGLWWMFMFPVAQHWDTLKTRSYKDLPGSSMTSLNLASPLCLITKIGYRSTMESQTKALPDWYHCLDWGLHQIDVNCMSLCNVRDVLHSPLVSMSFKREAPYATSFYLHPHPSSIQYLSVSTERFTICHLMQHVSTMRDRDERQHPSNTASKIQTNHSIRENVQEV